ncbi:hypothetical protein B0H14DRAFT_119640 [Mycena olivaceomarginata]|nr:hypothetical protein B0H14DRAFT_119640 [Mycena olivaceomarginata]
MLLLVYLVSLTAAFTALFPPTAGYRPKYRRTGKPHSRPHTLHPTVHPAIDRTDAQHLKATTGLSLHYHDPHAAFPRIRSFASVHVSEFIHPAVALEHSAHIVETICHSNVSTITVQFRNRDAWAIAKEDWKTHPNAFLVAFSDSCGLGRESGERSIHRVRNMTASWGKMEIAFEMTETPLKDAIHPDRDVEIVINTFEVHDPRPSVPNDRSRLRRRAGGALKHPAMAQMAVDNPRRVLNPIRVVSNKIRTGLAEAVRDRARHRPWEELKFKQ